MTVCKTLDGNALLMQMRDNLLAQASQLTKDNEQQLQEAKSLYHVNKININKIAKEAERVNSTIDKEKEQQVLDQREVEKQYSFKSSSQLSAELIKDQFQVE